MTNTTRTVAVTGASGFVGRYVVRELLRRGYGVRALVRSRAKAREALPRDPNVELLEADVLGEGVADELVRGTGACIHLIGIIREVGRQTFRRMHVDATRVMVEACQRAGGPRRFIHMSALGIGPDGKSLYQRTKWEGEQIVRRAGSGGAGAPGVDGLEWTIFRPGLIHGAESEFVQMVKDLASGQTAPWYFIPYFTRSVIDERVPMGAMHQESARVSPVAVEDVASAFAEALNRAETVGEVYNLVGPDEMTWPQVLVALRDSLPGTNHRLQPWGLPGDIAAKAAKAAGTVGLGGLLPFDEGQAVMAMEDMTSERVKAKAHLGLEPRPFAATLAGYAAHA